MDWCRRARDAGFTVLYVPAARVWHPDTASRDALSPLVTYYIARNTLLFARKHRLGGTVLARRFGRDALTLLSWSVRPSAREAPAARPLARALLDFVRGRFGRARCDSSEPSNQLARTNESSLSLNLSLP